tara:strand:+ start:921 stop:2141 length:1221 start_codon:yes stop_codon:yes gene_type:complete
MKRSIPFSTLQEINKKSKGRPTFLFGASHIAEKTDRILTEKKIKAIIDNDSNLWGNSYCDVEIFPPSHLNNFSSNKPFIIICTTSFREVSEQLEDIGYIAELDFFVSPILNDLRIINELESIETKILFSSGSPKQKNQEYGGGIYELNVSRDKWTNKKIISGNCYGLIKLNNNFISVDTEIGIFEFDNDYNILRAKKLPSDIRAHGVSFSKKHNKFFVVSSRRDAIFILDDGFNVLEQINISFKRERTSSAHHHCNDCLVVEDSLYVSMFSQTGNWKKDVFDGAILEYDIVTGNLIGPVIKDLWMPHNITMIQGSLHVLNSLQGQLLTNNSQIVGEFPAFTRGLANDGIFYYVGQSRNRNFSKNIGLSNNISIDAGIIIFDAQTKVSRFLQLPPKISEIHSILLID